MTWALRGQSQNCIQRSFFGILTSFSMKVVAVLGLPSRAFGKGALNCAAGDRYLVVKDFPSYVDAQKRVDATYADKAKWCKLSIQVLPFDSSCKLHVLIYLLYVLHRWMDSAGSLLHCEVLHRPHDAGLGLWICRCVMPPIMQSVSGVCRCDLGCQASTPPNGDAS